MCSDPNTARTHRLTTHAARAGYHLVRAAAPPYDWTLLDSDHGEPLFTAPSLDEIEGWLRS